MSVDHEHVSDVLADAVDLGDPPTARKWKISERTIRRYRERAKADPTLAALVTEKRALVSRDLATMRVAFMREAMGVLLRKLEKANVRSVAGALKIVGDLHLAASVFDGAEHERPDGGGEEGACAEEDARGAPRDAAGEVRLDHAH